MSYTLDQIMVNAYHAMLHHLAEQQGSKLSGLFPVEIAKGESHFFDRIGAFSVSEVVSLGNDIVNQDGQLSRRMANLRSFDASTLIHDIEKMKMLVDPTNDYVKKLVNAHGKNYDSIIIDAILGSAATGKAGAGSAATFDSNNVIAHGSAGMTVAKFLTALRILQAADVDMDVSNVYLLANARALEGLLGDAKFTSADYQNMKALSGKDLPMFRGVKIVHTERLPAIDATNFRCIMVVDNAVKVAKGADVKVDVSIRKDLQDQPFQIYTKQSFGAVRMEEALAVDIRFQ